MQFFPHNVSSTSVAQATSASLAQTVSYLNNFATTLVNTASVALNFTGSAGVSGSNFTKTGATGLQGLQGARGPRGDSAYILAVGWSSTTPTTCNAIPDVGTYNSGTTICSFENSVTFYSTSSIIADGTIVYYDSACSSLVTNISNLAISVKSFSTNGSGVVTIGADCGGGI